MAQMPPDNVSNRCRLPIVLFISLPYIRLLQQNIAISEFRGQQSDAKRMAGTCHPDIADADRFHGHDGDLPCFAGAERITTSNERPITMDNGYIWFFGGGYAHPDGNVE